MANRHMPVTEWCERMRRIGVGVPASAQTPSSRQERVAVLGALLAGVVKRGLALDDAQVLREYVRTQCLLAGLDAAFADGMTALVLGVMEGVR